MLRDGANAVRIDAGAGRPSRGARRGRVTPAGSWRATSIGPATATSPGSRTRRYQPVRPEAPHARLDVGPPAVQRELEARPAGLAHLQRRVAPGPDVADAHVVLRRRRRCSGSRRTAAGPSSVSSSSLHGARCSDGYAYTALSYPPCTVRSAWPSPREVEEREPDDGRRRERLLGDAAPHLLAARLREHGGRSDVHRGETDHDPSA